MFSKPYNKDFTEVLETQGLLFDEARGTTTSSARRETPSMVFGFNTPGPLDKRDGSPKVSVGPSEDKVDIPYNRLGGSSLVMDDGDGSFIRKTHPEDGPPLYVNKIDREAGGKQTIPQNELLRLAGESHSSGRIPLYTACPVWSLRATSISSPRR